MCVMGWVKSTESERAGRKPAAIKYRLGEKTWTGKGKKPKWYVDHLEAHGNVEALKASTEVSAEKTE